MPSLQKLGSTRVLPIVIILPLPALLVLAFKLSLSTCEPLDLDSEFMSVLALRSMVRKESGMVP